MHYNAPQIKISMNRRFLTRSRAYKIAYPVNGRSLSDNFYVVTLKELGDIGTSDAFRLFHFYLTMILRIIADFRHSTIS